VGVRGVSSDEDPSPEPSWSGDVPNAAVDWSEMSGSSSLSPPYAIEVSSSRQLQTATCDKKVGSSSRQAARPAHEDQRTVLPRVAPSGTGASEAQRVTPRQVDPLRQSEERPTLIRQLFDGLTAPTRTPCRGVDRKQSRRTRRRCRARYRRWIPASLRGVCSRYLSGVAEPRMFTFPSSPAGAKVQPRPPQRPDNQPPSGRGSKLLPLRRPIEAEPPLRWWAPSVQPPSRACRAARRRSSGCTPRCKLSSSELPSWVL
jgi:hypothetical protein